MISGGPVSGGGELPTGTVTLLLADIEGSTRLWQSHADEMPAAITRLDEIIDDAVTRHHGVRPVEQGEGDSFVIAFALASDAVACAMTLQQATADGLLRLRIGVHTGEVQRRNEGNYVGTAINRTARIRDTGHGGQTLLSQTTADIVAEQLPTGASLLELGEKRLRDFARPERIHQLAHPDLRAEFPPLRGLDAVQSNLPAQISSFVGRDEEIAHVRGLLAADRVVTLTGAGGCGKTRLALHIADALSDSYEAVWLVDFSPVNDDHALAGLVADAIGVARAPGRTELDALAATLQDKATLLVLDNCEHVIAGCAELTDHLVHACAGLTVLATSREPLGVVGEATYRVPSLSDDEAVTLFAERAARANARFHLDDNSALIVADICKRLDGIPLAIELAAARLRVFTPAQIRDGLHDRFRLLTGGARTAVQRQQTLQASVEWSYALLLEPERLLLHRLSVFAGGFTFEAAQAIGAGGGVEAHHVLDLLTQLVDKSLVILDEEQGRFRLLETIRQYAAARLVESGAADEARQRHFDFYFALTRRSGETIDEQNVRIDADYDNVRRALQWAEGLDDPTFLVRLAARLYGYWTLGSHVTEGLRWFEAATAGANTNELKSRVVGHCALLRMMVRGGEAALDLAYEAVAIARELDRPSQLAWSLTELGNVLSNVLRFEEAEATLYEAATIAAEHGDAGSEAFAWFQLGRHRTNFDSRGAREPLTAGLVAAEKAGAEYIVRMTKVCQAVVEWNEFNVDAPALIAESIDEMRASGDVWFLSSILAQYCGMLAYFGRNDEAAAALAEVHQIEGTTSSLSGGAKALAVGNVALTAGRWHEFRELLENETVLAQFGTLLGATVGDAFDGRPDLIAARLERLRPYESQFTARAVAFAEAFLAYAEGDRQRAEDRIHDFLGEDRPALNEPIAYFEAMKLVARLAADDGAHEFATRVLAGVHKQAASLGVSFDTALWREQVTPVVAVAREALGEERFTEVWDQGAALDRPALLDYVRRGRGERKKATTGWASLTAMEQQVVALVSEGLSNPAIADKLFITVATVKSHLTHVYAKLGISSRTELAAMAVTRNR